MSSLIAYCGLDCSVCPTYVATRGDDDIARARTAAEYAKKFGFDLAPEQIDCDGCRSQGGRIMAYCRSCAVRDCCRGRGLDNCALCPDQPCERLTEFHAFSPDAKTCFEALKKQMGAV